MRKVILILFLLADGIINSRSEEEAADDEYEDEGINPYFPSAVKCTSFTKYFAPEAMQYFESDCIFQSDCAESRFMDTSRYTLYKLMRLLRAALVHGTCQRCDTENTNNSITYGNIFLMRQHWYLEYSALFLFAKYGCPLLMNMQLSSREFPTPEIEDNLGTLPEIDSSDLYMGVTSIKINAKESQADALRKFIKFMTNGYDLLRTWNETDYTLGSASHYGCAIIIRDNVHGVTSLNENLKGDRAAYLVCLFAAEVLLVSYRGEVNNASCNANYGKEQYFDSVQTKMCMHLNLINAEARAYDIACEEPATSCSSMTTEKTRKSGKLEKAPDEEETVDEDQSDNIMPSGMSLFLIIAISLFVLLAIMTALHEQSTRTYLFL